METKELYPKLLAKMAYHGDTKSDIAKFLNLTPMTIYKRFSGVTDWQLHEIRELMKRYNCEFEDLV